MRTLLSTSLALLAVLVGAALAGSRGSGARVGTDARVSVTWRLVDGDGVPVPGAMVCVRSLDDDSVRLPPDGRRLERPSRTRAFYAGVSFDAQEPGWIGPVRKTTGRGDNDDRSFVYGDRPSVPFWREPVMFQVGDTVRVQLEPGRYRISVARGMEHVLVSRDFTVEAGSPLDSSLRVERWIDLAEEGWLSGDVHVHHPTLEAAHREFLLRYAEAEDLRIVNVLEMGHHRGTDFRQRGFGKAHREERRGYWLVSGQEEPRSTFGHIIGLNTTALARDLPTYDLYDLAFERLHAQDGALVGFAHFSWNGCDLPRGFPWYVTTEAIEFVELLQFGMLNVADYHAYLDLGFRLVAAAGSDIPWGSTIGEVRTYVHVGDRRDPDAWFDGLRAGRTFVSNGPALELSVDGALPGAELRPHRGATLRVRVRARGHARVALPSVLELHDGSGCIGRVEAGAVARDELVLERSVPATRSGWLAAHVRCENGAVAHTTPVWIVVDGEPTWSPQRGPAIIARQLEQIARIEAEFAGRDDERSVAVRARLERAREYYAKLLDAMRRARERSS